MMHKNNKLEPYVQHKGIRRRLEIMESKSPSLYKILQTIIVGVGKPIMAMRAGFYKATGGFFANSSIPWFKIIVILAGAYILTYKNLNLNFNLNSPPPQTAIPDYTSISVANTLSPIVSADFDDEANKAYIEEYKEMALQEMKVFGIPASIKLGQALLESEAGKSTNAISLNNHFNLRCGELQTGYCTETPNGMFNEFDSVDEGWRTHSKYLVTNEYSNLRKSAGNDYKIWAAGLKTLGYSPEREYAEKLLGIIEYYNLQELDGI
ncbi:MAG: glucosaminidase domain-containing protein [Saprospiraceae bacterium]